MQQSIDQFTSAAPDAQLMKQDEITIGKRRIGMLSYRHTVGPDARLTQQAILQLSKRYYYVIEFSSPGAKPGSPIDDPAEAEPKDVFRQILNTVRLLDQSKVREDQDARLLRTRTLFLGLKEATLKPVLVPEMYLRHLKNGKDVGYSYQVEEPYESAGQKGFRIGRRTRMIEDGRQIDSESWFFMTWDRKHEDFSIVTITDTGKEKASVTQLGVSNREVQRRVDRVNGVTDPNDPRQPPMREDEKASLSVSVITNLGRMRPIDQDLPVAYIPLALDQVLPRLVYKEPRTYLVWKWLPDRMRRGMIYVDAGREEMTMLADKTIRGTPVSTKLGLEGSTTITYITREGRFAGQINETEKTMTLPSTEQELTALWKDVDLSRPKVVETK
jgi:hypothetical protein